MKFKFDYTYEGEETVEEKYEGEGNKIITFNVGAGLGLRLGFLNLLSSVDYHPLAKGSVRDENGSPILDINAKKVAVFKLPDISYRITFGFVY